MTVLAVGAYMLDEYMFSARLPRPGASVAATEWAQAHGGKAANVSVAAARLGAPAQLVAAFGRDTEGAAALAALREEGVDVSFCPQVDGSTGRGVVCVDQQARQLVTSWSGASDRLSLEIVGNAAGQLGRGDVLVVQAEIPLELSLRAADVAVSRGALVMLNPSPVEPFDSAVGRHLMAVADVVVLNTGELDALTAGAFPTRVEAARRLLDLTGAGALVATHGGDGATVLDRETEASVPAPQVEAVDTTGAGDCFLGALAAAWQVGTTLADGAVLACRAAARSVAQRFCQPSYPTWRELNFPPHGCHGEMAAKESR